MKTYEQEAQKGVKNDKIPPMFVQDPPNFDKISPMFVQDSPMFVQKSTMFGSFVTIRNYWFVKKNNKKVNSCSTQNNQNLNTCSKCKKYVTSQFQNHTPQQQKTHTNG